MGSVAALLAWTLLPGLGFGLLLTRWDRETGTGEALLLRSASMALVTWTLGSQVLVRTVGLGATSAVVAAALSSAVGLTAVIWCRKSLMAHAGSLAYGCVAAIVTVVSYFPVLWVIVRTSWGPVGATPWYYWNLAEQILRSGHVPSSSPEWGVRVPFLADYQAFSSATAVLIAAGDGMVAIRAVVITTVLATGVAIVLVARGFGASRVPALLSIPVLLSLTVFATKFSSYRPEPFAYAVGLLLVANGLDWLRERRPGALAAAVALAAVLSQVHLIVGLITALLLVALSVALAVEIRPWRLWAMRVGTLGVACIAGGAVARMAFGRSATSVNLGPVESSIGDPTWEFNQAIQGLPYIHPPTGLELAPPWVRDGFVLTPGWPYWLLIAVSLTGAVLAWRRRVPGARTTLVTTLVFWALVVTVVTVIVTGWDTFVPRRTGGQRALQLAPIMLPVLFALVVSAGWQRMSGWLKAGLVVAVVGFGVASSVSAATIAAIQRPTEETISGLDTAPVPAGSVVLANAYTEGILERTMDAHGLLEGRAPYTFPALLTRANRQLRDAQAFFAHPQANAGLLSKYDVDYLLVSRKPWAMASGYRFNVNWNELNRQPEVRLIGQFDGVALFHVDSERSGR